MTFGRCWQKHLFHFVIAIQQIFNDLWNVIFDFISHFLKETFGNSAENTRHYTLFQFCVTYDIEMSGYSRSYKCTTSSWWSHCTKQYDIFQFHETQCFTIVPSLMIQILPQYFDSRLCEILLFLRHVQIVNENHTFLANRWSIMSSSSFIQFAVYSILSLVGRSGC